MREINIPQIAELSLTEKMQLMEELWDEISMEDSNIPVPLSHKKELDERLSQYNANPSNLLTLEELQERIHTGE